MSDTTESLRQRMTTATDLHSVVRTMKALAASNINQYENAVLSLQDYYRTVEMGLVAGLRQTDLHRQSGQTSNSADSARQNRTGIVIFGSDQGLVGQFNDVLIEYLSHFLATSHCDALIWTVGERMSIHLQDRGFDVTGLFPVPGSVKTISNLISQILIETEKYRNQGKFEQLYLFYHQPHTQQATFQPEKQRLLPLDSVWEQNLRSIPWPTDNLPEIALLSNQQVLKALIREYLFASLFRACAESLASENTSRLIAMQRAEKNIKQQLEEWQHTYHRLRQNSIDAELFDLVSGFEALHPSLHEN
ncbi:MAG: F0F1 ATP synthase subunit gamma [Gammaproteobacteria bacterium]|nr:F0F1 ATP synthase subunit gamma [Gammaproteobacteria bacterium]